MSVHALCQKVKGQGHDETKDGQKSTLWPVCKYRTLNGDVCFELISNVLYNSGQNEAKGQGYDPIKYCQERRRHTH